jgi:transposase-like protein
MNFNDIAKYTETEDKAREFLEAERWPKGAICPHCGVEGESYRLKAKEGSKSPVRPGVWKCGGCRKQFTVKVGTIFEDSHIPLTTWLKAIHLLCASKKGMSAHQLHRMLGVTYKSAWFMAHRIRYAMTQEPLSSKLTGIVEIDVLGWKESDRLRSLAVSLAKNNAKFHRLKNGSFGLRTWYDEDFLKRATKKVSSTEEASPDIENDSHEEKPKELKSEMRHLKTVA